MIAILFIALVLIIAALAWRLRWTDSSQRYRVERFPDDGDPVFIVLVNDGGWRVIEQPQTNNQPAKGKTRKSKSGQQNLAKLIDDAVKLRTSLHTLLHDSAELVKSLKQQRRANKAVQQTLDQIRTLKTLVA